MEQRYINILHRWLWLILLATMLAGVLTFLVSRRQPISYSARTRLLVGPGIDSPDPDLNDLRASAQLMQTYAELPTTGPFLQTIIDEQNLDVTVQELREQITISVNQETQIMSITSRQSDPVRAVVVTNALGETLVRLSPSGSTNPAAQLRAQIMAQAQGLVQNIAATEAIISELETAFQEATDLSEQRLIQVDITQEREHLSDTHNTLAHLYELLQTASINRVEIIEPATIATPIATQLGLKVMIGGLVGLIFSFLIVFGFEYFSNTVDDVHAVAQASGVPVLGAIARHKKLRGTGRDRIAVKALPESNAAEDYRMLGTKLLLSGDFRELKSVLISTAGPSGDTSELVANLAVVLSQTGSRVVLVDANLHHPTVAQLFDIEGRAGLTDILTGQAEVDELTPISWVPGLSILPSGPVSFDSFALLASTRMTHLLSRLEEMSDIVIVVASSILSFADSLFLTTNVDGVILIARSGKTQSDTIRSAVNSLHMVGAPILGTVLLNSREGSAQMTSPASRRNYNARQALAHRTNGHRNKQSPMPSQSDPAIEEAVTVPIRLARSPEKRP